MKYRVLLTGKSNSIIDDFFEQMYDCFEALTTSARHDDMLRHIRYFEPDIFVYCLYNEPRENYNQIISIRYKFQEQRIAFVVIGSKEDCDEFERVAVNTADLVLYKPLSADSVQKEIEKLLKRRNPGAAEEEPAISPSAMAGSALGVSPFPRGGEADDEDAFMERVAAFERMVTMQTQPPEEPQPPKRRLILVVDDDPLMLKMLKEQLREEYDVATAVSGKIALKYLERRRPDLILLDYQMPVESGAEILEKIRAKEEIREIPVVFLTGVSEREKIQEALALKPQGYLLKPVERSKLLEIIKKVTGTD